MLKHHTEPIVAGKKSFIVGDINCQNNTQRLFSNLPLKTYSPTKIKSLLNENALKTTNKQVNAVN